MVSRRRFLKALVGGSGLTASAGCVGTRWWEDEQDGEEEINSESSDSSGDETDRTDPTADENEPSSEQEDDENSTEDNGESAQEHQSNDEEDRQHEPDEEDLEVDEDEYEDHSTSETEQRSPADIEIDAEADLEDSGAARVAGTVTNVSETAIDVVDLEITFSDADGGYLTADLVSVHDLGTGESDSFESTITPDQARGQPGNVDIEPTVYDRMKSD